jgi:hypothetical protein
LVKLRDSRTCKNSFIMGELRFSVKKLLISEGIFVNLLTALSFFEG